MKTTFLVKTDFYIYLISYKWILFQVGDFLLLHLLGQNMNMSEFNEVLDDLSSRLHLGNNLPTAPSTLELSPMYPSDKLRLHKETEA